MPSHDNPSMPPQEPALISVLNAASVPDGARKILEAAAPLFARKGYGPTTMRAIAAEAGVTVPMVYYYFNGKEKIFVKLCETAAAHLFDRLHAVRAQQIPSFQQELVEIARVFRSLLYPCPVILQLMTQLVFGPPESRPLLTERCGRNVMSETFQQIFESASASGRFHPMPGYAPADLAAYFINVIHGHMMFALKLMERASTDNTTLYQEFLTDEALESLVDIFLNGAGKSSS